MKKEVSKKKIAVIVGICVAVLLIAVVLLLAVRNARTEHSENQGQEQVTPNPDNTEPGSNTPTGSEDSNDNNGTQNGTENDPPEGPDKPTEPSQPGEDGGDNGDNGNGGGDRDDEQPLPQEPTDTDRWTGYY